MSIASEITRINNNIANAYTQCSNKGATMPATQNSANLANTISTISGGGGADLDDYFNVNINDTPSNQNVLNKDFVIKIPTLKIANGITSLTYLFYEWPFNTISFQGIDCTNITNLSSFFNNSTQLKSIDLANITNVDNITTFRYLFNNCAYLETISNIFPLTKDNVDIRNLCTGCNNLKTLDLSNWNLTTSYNNNMFQNCYKLAIIDISNLEFTGGTILSSAFRNCGRDCLQSDGAYADGIPYVYVKDTTQQGYVLGSGYVPSTWSTNNVVIKSS